MSASGAAPAGRTIDAAVPRFNQACVAALTALAFVLQWPWLVIVVFVALGFTYGAGPRYGPFTGFYLAVVKPRRSAPVETEPAAPPRFALLLGTIFLGLATATFLGGWPVAGWVLTLLVTALAALAAATRICVGCLIYTRAAGESA